MENGIKSTRAYETSLEERRDRVEKKEAKTIKTNLSELREKKGKERTSLYVFIDYSSGEFSVRDL